VSEARVRCVRFFAAQQPAHEVTDDGFRLAGDDDIEFIFVQSLIRNSATGAAADDLDCALGYQFASAAHEFNIRRDAVDAYDRAGDGRGRALPIGKRSEVEDFNRDAGEFERAPAKYSSPSGGLARSSARNGDGGAISVISGMEHPLQAAFCVYFSREHFRQRVIRRKLSASSL